MHSKTIPIGATIKYGSFVMSAGISKFKKTAFTNKILFVEFKELLENFTFMEMDINGCKKRTARGWFEM